MTSVERVLHVRRDRRRRSGTRDRATAPLLALGLAAVLAAGGGMVAGGRVVFAAAAGLPSAESIQDLFGPQGEEQLRAAQLYDRTGQVLLAEVVHPLARDRQWQPLDRLPESVKAATVAALDPSFWSNAGYDPASAARTLVQSLAGREEGPSTGTITERLAAQTQAQGSLTALSAPLLAADIAATYPKERVLEWFLNSAEYGNLAFGIDAAARVYTGKTADRLTLGEAAFLAALPAHPEVDPLRDAEAARELQRQVLASMRAQGWITAGQERQAALEPIQIQADEARRSMQGLAFVQIVWDELRRSVGAAAAAQAGARVVTTLDLDLQLQADCVARTHLARMDGGDPFGVLPAADGSPCAAASLLPPLRPGDSGRDHQIDAAATIVLDPSTGEVRAVTGPAGEARPAGEVLAPFIYLSAFSRGYTPSTMVIDSGEGDDARGPIRLRTALAELDASVTDRLSEQLGPDVIGSTLSLVGLESEGGAAPSARLDRLTAALGLLANRGVQAGVVSPGGAINASTLQAVYLPDGAMLYRAEPGKRSVISEGLAFLLNDILSDEAARVEVYGPGSPFEIGRPAASVTAAGKADNWALGYTPRLAIGAWVGAQDGGELAGVHAVNGAAPIWHALMRYASRDLPAAGWPMPPDVTELEVCDPSGYLPTPFCPRVLREVFLAGTEPTHSDSLYRAFRINKETGRLATYFTPLDQVEEVVYFVPPPEAEAWAEAEGLQPPPDEYDRISLPGATRADVNLGAPRFFEIVSGPVQVVGSAAGEGFSSYRLDVGQGLDPQAWLQIGEASQTPVGRGQLGRWDTSGLNGAAILRLTVIRRDGTVDTTAVPVTIDNRPPVIELVVPTEGATFSRVGDRALGIQVEASDETLLDRVVIFVDDRSVWTGTGPPWGTSSPLGSAGEHVVRARAYDAAGNWADTEEVSILVAP